ncbi:MAG: ATP-binding protein [Dehalococcoidia bacterium]
MTPKQSWSNKLKAWQKGQDEATAKALMSPPAKKTLLSVVPVTGVILIMGSRGSGKSGLAHEIIAQVHARRKMGGALLLPSIRKKPKLPAWIKVVSSTKELPVKSVCVIDEAAQVAHARRSQSAQAIEMDNLVSISRQRQQLIVLVSHHARKLDLNLIHDADKILWKEPTEAHALFERDELQMFTRKALDFFGAIRGTKARQRATYVMDLHHLQFSWFNNDLPAWWSEDVSCGFQRYKP